MWHPRGWAEDLLADTQLGSGPVLPLPASPPPCSGTEDQVTTHPCFSAQCRGFFLKWTFNCLILRRRPICPGDAAGPAWSGHQTPWRPWVVPFHSSAPSHPSPQISLCSTSQASTPGPLPLGSLPVPPGSSADHGLLSLCGHFGTRLEAPWGRGSHAALWGEGGEAEQGRSGAYSRPLPRGPSHGHPACVAARSSTAGRP